VAYLHVSLLISKLSFMAIISLHSLSLANRHMTASLALALNPFIWHCIAHCPALTFPGLLGHCVLSKVQSKDLEVYKLQCHMILKKSFLGKLSL